MENSADTESRYSGLKPFKPGESGNPNGRPKGARSRSTIVNEWLELTTDGEPNIDRVMRALIKKASEGDVAAIRETLDSAFGKVADKQEITGADGGPVQVSQLDKDILDQYLNKK